MTVYDQMSAVLRHDLDNFIDTHATIDLKFEYSFWILLNIMTLFSKISLLFNVVQRNSVMIVCYHTKVASFTLYVNFYSIS